MSKSKKILRIVMFILGAVAVLPAIKPVDNKVYAGNIYYKPASTGIYVLLQGSSGSYCCCSGKMECGAACCSSC